MESLSDHKHLGKEIAVLFFDEWKSIYNYKDSNELYESYISKNIDKFRILVLEDKFVGCYSVSGIMLSDVYVIPHHRRKGIGTFMIRDAMKNLYFIMALFSKPETAGFYKKLGFLPIAGEEKILMIKPNYLIILLAFVVLYIVAFR